jgi:hypothetical protein
MVSGKVCVSQRIGLVPGSGGALVPLARVLQNILMQRTVEPKQLAHTTDCDKMIGSTDSFDCNLRTLFSRDE